MESSKNPPGRVWGSSNEFEISGKEEKWKFHFNLCACRRSLTGGCSGYCAHANLLAVSEQAQDEGITTARKLQHRERERQIRYQLKKGCAPFMESGYHGNRRLDGTFSP
ncbi:hypothetical protein RUM44_001669 [Polyplax serrata]|uniref:Uncharacterized protein n=1 Tax=Polyplax serrata TaxID=468196 RepID=A0ABR1ALF6_POLSC